MALMFVTLGCIAFYNGYVFSLEGRWTYADLTDDVAIFANTWSISDFTPATYTPVTTRACSGHGFAARVCAPGGWTGAASNATAAVSVYDYECGRAPSNLTIMRSFYSILLDPIGLGVTMCQKDVAVCSCMPGWTGPKCATRRPSESLNMTFDGWCRPSRDALAALNGTARDAPQGKPADFLIPPTIGPSVCSGNGACLLRAPAGSRNFSYTFCSCNMGFWGSNCEFSEAATARSIGRFDYQPTNVLSLSLCKSGIVPTEDRWIGFAQLPIARCSQHGTMVLLPVDDQGKFLSVSSFYRPQTSGVCACEPGYTGEQCLGGREVENFSSVSILSACMAITLLMGSLMLYRERKKMDFHFDATHITPSDFTLFVDDLPDLTTKEVPEIVQHFSRWGKVHSVAPALDDEMLRWWRTRLNEIMRLELVYVQLDLAAKGEEVKKDEDGEDATGGTDEDGAEEVASSAPVAPAADSCASDPAIGTTARKPAHIDHRWWEKRCAVPKLKPGETAYGAAVTRFFCLPVVFDIVTLLRGPLRKLYWGVRARMEEELESEDVLKFNRCFVTYETTESCESALEAYQDNDVIFCSCKRAAEGETHDEGELFRGTHDIKVEQAPEPTEVIWDSLDTSPRERAIRLWVCFVVLIGFCIGLFNVIMNLPTDQPGLAGLLASTAVVIINMFAAQLWWLLSTYAEQQPTEGDKARSVFYKTLFTQLTVMLAANVGVSGVPMDSKNGYIQDFYSGTAGFMMRTTITEAILPPTLSILAIGWRVNLWLSGKSPSPDLAEWAHEPPPFLLAERCASFMRIVIMCCAFSAGMPLMTFFTAACIASQYVVDTATLTRIYALAPAGPELPRAIESMLIFGSLINCSVSWLTLRDGSNDALAVRVTLFATCGVLLWAASGYFSWKWFKGRDCFGGTGLFWLGPVFCYSKYFMRPLEIVHVYFMETLLGRFFYETRNKAVDATRDELRSRMYSKNMLNAFAKKIGGSRRRLNDALHPRTKKKAGSAVAPALGTRNTDADALAAAEAVANNADETGGRPYSQIARETPAWELRAHPYCLWERAQLGTWMRPGLVRPPAPSHTAIKVHTMREHMLAAGGRKRLPAWLVNELDREEDEADRAW
jgi:hypothetical protein